MHAWRGACVVSLSMAFERCGTLTRGTLRIETLVNFAFFFLFSPVVTCTLPSSTPQPQWVFVACNDCAETT